MNQDLDILISETSSHIAQMLGHSEELKSAAMHEQRLLDALCVMKGELDDYKKKYDGNRMSLCSYINIEAVLKAGIWQPEQIEEKLRQTCEKDSKALAKFLRDYEKMGYLDFHGDSKKKILETLQEHFPTMRHYEYYTFATYF